MGQITIYLDDAVEEKMIEAAKIAKQPKSKWIAGVISEKVATEWPSSIIALEGAWKDLPVAKEIRQNYGKDVKREDF